MAESFLRSSRFGDAKLIVNTHVSDGLVWGAARGLLGRIEGPRILRDELRVASRFTLLVVPDSLMNRLRLTGALPSTACSALATCSSTPRGVRCISHSSATLIGRAAGRRTLLLQP
jgi:hypothetical protein